MDKEKLYKVYFWVVGVYDILLGGAFLLFYKAIYGFFNITPANHPGYIYFPAAVIVAGGIGEFLIAKNPLCNTDLVIVRLLMKLSFAVIIFYYFFKQSVPIIFVIIACLSTISVVKSLFFLSWARSATNKA
ncbi:MAG TPA: hypothetical protein PKV84_01660 [Candidatus Omnitrophota bacterium]|nr:hypothetical protein [Candidatus Omnitrophota bacterium]